MARSPSSTWRLSDQAAGRPSEVHAPTMPVANPQAFVDLGPGGQIGPAPMADGLTVAPAWADEHSGRPSELGVRVTFLASAPATEGSPPDSDVAVPIS
jgi:hypothetical protein